MFPESALDSHGLQGVSNYLDFTYEAFQALHLRLPKFLKECTVYVLSSNAPRPVGARRGGNFFSKVRALVRRD